MNRLGPSQGDRLSLSVPVAAPEPPPYALQGTQQSDTSLRDFLSILRRRKAIALQTFVMVVAMGAVVTFMTKPLYRSTSTILVEPKAALVNLNSSSDDTLSSAFLPPAGHDVSTQVEVLRSPALTEKVCNEIKIAQKDVRLDVRQINATDVIELNATSHSSAMAQKFSTALPEVYLRDIKAGRIREVTTALDFARRQLNKSNAHLIASEQALEGFKDASGVVDMDVERTGAIAAAAAADSAARTADTEAAGATAKYDALQSASASLAPTIDTPTTTTNPDVAQLQQKISTLEDQRKQALFLYKPTEDAVVQLDQQIANLKQRLASTPLTITTHVRAPNTLRGSYETSVSEAKAAARAATASAVEAKARAARLKAALPIYNPIERTESKLLRDIENDRNTATTLTKSVEDLSLRQRATEAKADPISVISADDRATQVAPNIVRNILMSLLLGVLLATGAAMLQDSLDDHVNDEEELRWLLNTPILGHLPLLPEGQSRLVSLRLSDASLLERFRVLRSNVQFTLVNRPNRVLMVTSTIPEEGKSSTAANLAISIALDNRKVILVDADLHRPRVEKLFGLTQQPGLTNVLVGQSSLEEALQQTDIPGLRVLAAGVLPPNPAELLNSPSMDDLLQLLKESADIVVFDTPPCLATADAQVLSAKVDGVIYITELGKVRKSAIHRSFELLYQARANVLGVVLNKVPQNDRSSYYNYGYYGYTDGDGKDKPALEDVRQAVVRQPHALSANGANGKADANGSANGVAGDGVAGDGKDAGKTTAERN